MVTIQEDGRYYWLQKVFVCTDRKTSIPSIMTLYPAPSLCVVIIHRQIVSFIVLAPFPLIHTLYSVLRINKVPWDGMRTLLQLRDMHVNTRQRPCWHDKICILDMRQFRIKQMFLLYFTSIFVPIFHWLMNLNFDDMFRHQVMQGLYLLSMFEIYY
jgi:hypothetical protein